jgi:peptidoglycan/LPS O-acetylase OafA/YrhL
MDQDTRYLTGVRGVLCFIVVEVHGIYINRLTWHAMSAQALHAVYYFFVLSGYLLFKRGLQDIQRTKETPPKRFFGLPLLKFLVRRVFRIIPPYWLTVIISAYLIRFGLIKLPPPDIPGFPTDIWNELFFRNAPMHLWSIKPEFYFYFTQIPYGLILCAELMKIDYSWNWLKRRGISLVKIFYVLFSITIIYFHIKWIIINKEWDYFFIPKFTFLGFFYGCLGGLMSYYIGISENYREPTSLKSRILTEVAIFLILLKIVSSNSILAYYFYIPGERWDNQYPSVCPLDALLLLVLECGHPKTFLRRILGLKPIVFLGETSYSIYLGHYFVASMYENYLLQPTWERYNLIPITFLCVIWGCTMHFLCEKPGIKIGNYLARKIDYFGNILQDQATLYFKTGMNYLKGRKQLVELPT